MRVQEDKKLEAGECARKRKDGMHFTHTFYRCITVSLLPLRNGPPENLEHHLK